MSLVQTRAATHNKIKFSLSFGPFKEMYKHLSNKEFLKLIIATLNSISALTQISLPSSFLRCMRVGRTLPTMKIAEDYVMNLKTNKMLARRDNRINSCVHHNFSFVGRSKISKIKLFIQR
jgi:hypothetical protein